jgi:DNA repair protein RadD
MPAIKPKIVLRPYQEEAVEKGVWSAKNFDNNSLLVLPTAAGKSLVVSGIAKKLQKEILILQPSREILAQNMAKLALYIPEDEIGAYSASFKRKDIKTYNFATIQSIYKKPELFDHIGLVIVDECDLVNPRNLKGMFTSFLKGIGNPTTIGLTATPFRNVTGYAHINGTLTAGTALKLINRMNPRVWNRISYNISSGELLKQGYLAPLKYYSRTAVPQIQIPLNKSRSDFDLDAYDKLILPHEEAILESINGARKHRKAVLVFCSSVAQAERFAKTLTKSEIVTGKTPTKERDAILKRFQSGELQVLFNVSCLTVGYDYPALDTIYLLRPTRSLRLYMQMLGRGVRIAEGKNECIVIDYSGTYDSMGKIEDIKLIKEKLWELYAGGQKVHGKEIFSWSVK